MKFSQFFFENLRFWKNSVFQLVILEVSLLHPHENQSKLLGYQGWFEILMITLVYSKRVSVRNNLLHSACMTLNIQQKIAKILTQKRSRTVLKKVKTEWHDSEFWMLLKQKHLFFCFLKPTYFINWI